MLESHDMRTRQLVRDLIRKTTNPERRYINDRGTLITLAVCAHHDSLRDGRVKRAEASLEAARWGLHQHGSLILAKAELKIAKRIAANHNASGEVCVVHVSPVKMPRQWPNALPGGTSPRRAANTVAIIEAKTTRDYIYRRNAL